LEGGRRGKKVVSDQGVREFCGVFDGLAGALAEERGHAVGG
jgi:hypothetical protein